MLLVQRLLKSTQVPYELNTALTAAVSSLVRIAGSCGKASATKLTFLLLCRSHVK
jgi:hypothetical protein